MTASLYRHFDAAGRLLYVGISLNALSRLSQHKSESSWFFNITRVEIEQHPTRAAAAAAEIEAIRTEDPLHNVMGRNDPPSWPAGSPHQRGKPGRPPIGERAQTPAERQRRCRARKRAAS